MTERNIKTLCIACFVIQHAITNFAHKPHFSIPIGTISKWRLKEFLIVLDMLTFDEIKRAARHSKWYTENN